MAVEDLGLRISAGEIFGLLGPNGAGKSTTINISCGLLKPTRGKVLVGGFDVHSESAKVRTIIGVCPQEPAIFGTLTGRENVDLFGNLHGMPKGLLKQRENELLDRIGLSDAADRRAGKYSGGMSRRLSLVMALIQDPKIAFLDEPTTALDPQARHAIWEFIKELKDKGKTVVLTTHYIEEAEALCDRVGIIDHGNLIALDTPEQLIEQNGGKNLEDVFIGLTGRKIREEN